MSKLTIRKVENGGNTTIDTLLKIANHFDFLQTIHKGIDELNNTGNNSSFY